MYQNNVIRNMCSAAVLNPTDGCMYCDITSYKCIDALEATCEIRSGLNKIFAEYRAELKGE